MEALKVKDYSKELEVFLSPQVHEVMKNKVVGLVEPDKWEIKYVAVTFKKGQENKAFTELARKLEAVCEKYEVIGTLSLCLGLDLAGPEGIASGYSQDWDYKMNPIGPGTLGWGKSEEEQERLRDRIVILSYPALSWKSAKEVGHELEKSQLFTAEGMIPPQME